VRWLRVCLRWWWTVVEFQDFYVRTFNGKTTKKKEFTALSAGVYHFEKTTPDSKVRIHLRVEADGNGLLLVNANRAFHLNPTATLMAFHLLKENGQTQIIKALISNYHVSKMDAEKDFTSFYDQFSQLIDPNGACPIHDLGVEATAPFSHRPSAPYRMDLAITYRCNNDCSHCYNERTRAKTELSTDEWREILNQLWDVGIPHIVFTGGEPTLREDLPDLIAHAENLGQIAGINTNGRKLKDTRFVDVLVQAGLDHVQITLESHRELVHDSIVNHTGAWQETTAGIRNALKQKLFVMTNSTLLKTNSPYLSETLDFLADLGVPTIGLNALIHSGRGTSVQTGLDENELKDLLVIAKEKTQHNHQRLIWYTPTQYCHFDPVLSDLGVKGCTAALYNMCVEPDGNVIPCQSYYQSLGKLLLKKWPDIWNHPLATSLRERRNVPIQCLPCPLFQECGGGCPLAFERIKPTPAAIHADLPA
jgi:radical SAM protein with 4Fe4S-binding SPASM domain